jgi:PKD repeat protein
MRRAIHALVLLVAASIVTSCSLDKTEAPPLSGPSELGMSLNLTANPDVLTQDGFSQSLITVEAKDPNGRPLSNVALRAEILVGNVAADFGQLSARTIVTGTDGKALLTYTAPPAPREAVDTFTVVTLLLTPTGTDFRNAVPRQIDIRLVPRGVILPPNSTPVPSFTYSPSNPSAFSTVSFDASSSRDDGTITNYSWQFGDGSSGSGVRPSHQFRSAGDYQVTLTVTDDRNLSASVTRTVTVSAAGLPTADFSFSPTRPGPKQVVFFNGSASKAATGRTIVSYEWDLGNGRGADGVTVTTSYAAPGSFAVTLVVTDDAGQTASTTKSVPVEEGAPGSAVASFSFSPTDPVAGVTRVFFNGSASTAAAGIASYEWDLGDGATATGITTDHVYQRAGSFEARLTIRDNLGVAATATKTVTVKAAGAPTADFSFSPSKPAPGQTVTFNASASTAATGRTIVSYTWDLGNGQTRSGVSVTTSYSAPGAFNVTLTVRDDGGLSSTTTKSVTVESSAAPVADFSFSPSKPTPNQTVTFNASASTAASGRTIVSYTWDMGNGQTRSGVSVTTSYATAGTFNVTLTVRDDAGRTGTTSKGVTVEGTAGGIVASFTFSPTDPVAGLTNVFFNASASTAPNGIATYAWSFGDSSTGTGVTTNHQFARAGTYSVRLTITDNTGLTATTASNVTVSASALPTADFAFSPTNPGPNQTVTFNASASKAASGRTLVAYDWDLGNGVTKSGITVTNSYANPGTFAVTLTVTDDIGQKAAVSKSVVVATGSPGGPVASFSFSPTDPTTSTQVFFNGSGSTAPAGIASYAWDFGDGCKSDSTGSSTCPTGSTNGVITSHTFSKGAGTYVARLTITDNAGNTATTTKDVTVK